MDFWPTQILLKNGKIVYKHIGEGNYKKLENEIVKILDIKSFPEYFEFTKEFKNFICDWLNYKDEFHEIRSHEKKIL